MSGMLDDLKKYIKELSTLAADKAGEFTRVAADRAEEITKIGKIKLDTLQLKRELDSLYAEFGESLFRYFKENKNLELEKQIELKELFDRIQEKINLIKEKEKEIARLKEEEEAEEKKTTTEESQKERGSSKEKTSEGDDADDIEKPEEKS